MALTKVPNELSSTPSIVDGGNAAAITIDSSQNVSVGGITGSASGTLKVKSNSSHLAIALEENSGNEAYNLGVVANGSLIFANSGTEVVRFDDSSGNLLVGKSALEYENTAGHIFRNDGLQSSIRSGGNAADFNRLSSDGEIVRLSKDGTTVGSVGTFTGDLTIFSSTASHVGLRFGNTRLQPTDNTGATSDGASDLGFSNSRFKDCYLSGGAYLGGTATANKLDDYEEGTWTPTIATTGGSITLSTSEDLCSYTKIGRLVVIHGRVLVGSVSSPTGQIYIKSLPFTMLSSVENSVTGAPAIVNLYDLASSLNTGLINAEFTSSYSGSILIRQNGGTNTSVTGTANKFYAGSRIGFSLCYLTGQ